MSNLDDKIRGLFDKLNSRKAKVAELEAAIAKGWVTNLAYRMAGANTVVNLNTVPAEGVVDLVADLVLTNQARTEAALLLGMTPSNKFQGYSFEQWVEDSKKRLAAINIREEKKELEALETRLNSVLSPEERRRIEVEALLSAV
jgi:hypothetical protein